MSAFLHRAQSLNSYPRHLARGQRNRGVRVSDHERLAAKVLVLGQPIIRTLAGCPRIKNTWLF